MSPRGGCHKAASFYAQGHVRELAASLHVPRAASREDESSLLDCVGREL